MMIDIERKTVVILLLLVMIVYPQKTTLSQPQSVPAITLSFDDNNINQYTIAWPLMKERGMVGTFYIVTDWISDWGAYKSTMNTSQIIDLQNNCNEIGSHSKSHRTFTELTESEIKDECRLSKETLESFGCVVNNFAYPNGLSNETIDEIVSEYYRSGRYGEGLMNLPVTTFHIHHNGWDWSLDQYKELVDKAYSEKKWAVLNFHNIGGDTTGDGWITTEDLTELLDYILSKEAMVITVNQALDIIATLFVKHNSLKAECESLITRYNDLMSDLEGLKKDYFSLNSSFNSLQDSYNSLKVSYDSLTKEYNFLRTRYNELESKYEISVEELGTTRNMMVLWNYSFIIVTIAFLSTIFFFTKRKLKRK